MTGRAAASFQAAPGHPQGCAACAPCHVSCFAAAVKALPCAEAASPCWHADGTAGRTQDQRSIRGTSPVDQPAQHGTGLPEPSG